MNNQEIEEYMGKHMYRNRDVICRDQVFALSAEICATGVLVHLYLYCARVSGAPLSLAILEQRVRRNAQPQRLVIWQKSE